METHVTSSDKLARQLRAALSLVQHERKANENLTKRVQALEDELEKRNCENKTIQNDHAISDLEIQIDQTHLNEEKKWKEMEIKVELEKNRTKQLEELVEKMKNENAQVIVQIHTTEDEKNTQNTQLQQELQNARQEVQALREAMATSTATATATATSALAEIDQRDRRISELQSTLSSLRAEKNSSQSAETSEVSALRDELERKQASHEEEVNSLRSQLSKLSVVESRLMQTFKLLKAEKASSASLRSELEAATQKLAEQTAKHQQILRTQQTLASERAKEIELLQAANRRLTAAAENNSRIGDELIDVRKQLQLASNRNHELEDLLERERAHYEKEKAHTDRRIEQLLEELERSSRDREHAQMRSLAEKREMTAQFQSELSAAEHARDEFAARMSDLATELKTAQQAKEETIMEVDQAKQALRELEREHENLRSSRERQLRSIEFKHISKYERLIKEHEQLRASRDDELSRQKTIIEQLQDEVRHLEDEIASGRPGDRKLLELANLQAKREDQIRQYSREISKLQSSYEQLEEKLTKVRQERSYLLKQLEAVHGSRTRSNVNLDYLKSVVVKYLQFDNANDVQQRQQLVPVLAHLLSLTSDDMKSIKLAQASGSLVPDGAFSSLFNRLWSPHSLRTNDPSNVHSASLLSSTSPVTSISEVLHPDQLIDPSHVSHVDQDANTPSSLPSPLPSVTE